LGTFICFEENEVLWIQSLNFLNDCKWHRQFLMGTDKSFIVAAPFKKIENDPRFSGNEAPIYSHKVDSLTRRNSALILSEQNIFGESGILIVKL
jgi:hypothetical protein